MRNSKFILTALLGFLPGAPFAFASYSAAGLEQVPASRIVKNLRAKLKKDPADAAAAHALARTYALMYAQSLAPAAGLMADKKTKEPWFPPDTADFPFEKKGAGGSADDLARAIEYFNKAAQRKADDALLQLGLAWCLEEAKEKAEAIAHYRKALDAAEKGDAPGPRPLAAKTAAERLAALLDPQKDQAEVAKLQARVKELAKIKMPVSPILIPLGGEAALASLIDAGAHVPFDLDGSGAPQRYAWPRPGKAAFLVFDPDGKGVIRSGRDLFGNVTFWVFWPTGYEALAALDDDADGLLTGQELAGLALWSDANADGVSEPGEVLPLAACGVAALSVRYEVADGTPWSPRGVRFRDGAVRPTYDWIAR